jgi:hypothetical protein
VPEREISFETLAQRIGLWAEEKGVVRAIRKRYITPISDSLNLGSAPELLAA